MREGDRETGLPFIIAIVAQRIERLFCKQRVGGSIPSSSSIPTERPRGVPPSKRTPLPTVGNHACVV